MIAKMDELCAHSDWISGKFRLVWNTDNVIAKKDELLIQISSNSDVVDHAVSPPT